MDPESIKPGMVVLGSDGARVGRVDALEDTDIRLAKLDLATLGHHYRIPLDWVDRVGRAVHLKIPRRVARSWWRR